MLKRGWFIGLLIIISQFGYASEDSIFKTQVNDKQIKVMAYNVQNLFDAKHDEGKNDYEFLPKSDPNKANCPQGNYYEHCIQTSWTQRKVSWKLDTIQIALDAQGDYPDILVLSEVENPEVISQLASRLGYNDFKMTNSPDARGIDLAVLYKTDKLNFVSFEEIEVQGVPYATRNASAVHFEVKTAKKGKSARREILGIYPAHWPSQGTKASFVRINAGMSMRGLIDKYTQKYSKENYYAVALGDFNTLESESPNPIETVVLDPTWENRMYDAETLARQRKTAFVPYMPEGTYFYSVNNAWNKFDHIFVSSSLVDGKGTDMNISSFRINAHGSISAKNDAGEKIPYRFNHRAENKTWMGFSDHFGIHMIIDLH